MSDFRAETASLEADVRRLLARVYERYGADFREYAPASISRRIANCVAAEGLDSVPQLEERLLSDPECAERFVRAVTVHVTTMFRNPEFYRAFRETVVGRLRERPFIRIWHAGCSTGEEVYSLAVLLHEEGLAARCLIYATDLSEQVLESARQGIFSQTRVREFTTNYIAAGGRRSFSDYYTAKYGRAIFRKVLRDRVIFSRHDLAADGPFNAFDVVLCRNVLIYFNETLAARVHRLLYDSLVPEGILGLGRRESIRFTACEDGYEVLDADVHLYRKRTECGPLAREDS